MELPKGILFDENDIKSEKELKEAYRFAKQKHPRGCYGMWTWISGSLKVWCQGCGYAMRINPKTNKLEHLDIDEAMSHAERARTYLAAMNRWKQ